MAEQEREITPDEVKEYLQKHKISKYLAEASLKAVIKTAVFIHSGPEGLRRAKDPERTTGLLEGAILASRLCYPSKEIGSLVFRQAHAGQFLGFDFNRPLEFPMAAQREDFKQEHEGNLWGLMLDEVQGKPSSERTPTHLPNVFSIDHILSLDKRSTEALLDEGMLERVTHAEAYDRVGAGAHIPELRSRSVDTEYVHQVTPKGNALLRLVPDGGSSTPKPDPAFEFAKIPGLLAH